MENNVTEWICKWIIDNTWVSENDFINSLNKNIFESGWVDSVDFVSLYSELEDQFEIEFSDKDFDTIYLMPTINNIVKIVGEKIK